MIVHMVRIFQNICTSTAVERAFSQKPTYQIFNFRESWRFVSRFYSERQSWILIFSGFKLSMNLLIISMSEKKDNERYESMLYLYF